MTRDVACALAGHAAHEGWLIKKGLENQTGRVQLKSRETPTPPALLLEWTDGNGVSVTAAQCAGGPPGNCTPTATVDVTCNGIDEDCDGVADDDFEVQASACGVGACAAAGETSCVNGSVIDSCSPAAPAPQDATCNGIDDDCDATTDEEYVGAATSCGIGACTASGTTSCVASEVEDSCTPGSPLGADANCDGVDDDCDGIADDAFVASCDGSTARSCVDGSLQTLNCLALPSPIPLWVSWFALGGQLLLLLLNVWVIARAVRNVDQHAGAIAVSASVLLGPGQAQLPQAVDQGAA